MLLAFRDRREAMLIGAVTGSTTDSLMTMTVRGPALITSFVQVCIDRTIAREGPRRGGGGHRGARGGQGRRSPPTDLYDSSLAVYFYSNQV
jgi:hypothetical protein